ncbi:MAG: type II secretory pathway, component PulF [Desulfotalea sp.]|nr:MAG: type II secretory pathway, component PulF [Desulfotalea sp.]
MPIYSYKGLDARGDEQYGEIEASNEKDVARQLRERSIFVLKVEEGAGIHLDSDIRGKIMDWLSYLQPMRYAPVSSGDLIIFFRQIALMLRAGYTLVTALDACYEMVSKLRLKKTIGRMADEIRRGSTFSAMLKKEKGTFSPMVANLVASGEQSGNLDSILDRLAQSLEQGKDLKRQMTTALVYPSFVLVASFGVVVFLVLGVIPRFATFLSARSVALPASTQMLMSISAVAVDYGKIFATVAGVSIFGVLASYTTIPGKRVIDRIILAIPVIGTAVSYASMAQAGWSLSMLLQSGVTALESLRITSSVIGNLAVSDCFKRAAAGLLAGRPLSKTFKQAHITLMMRHMAAVGESSGQLDTVMYGVGEYYQKELSAKVRLIASLVEPILILMVGGMVGFVYYAFFQAVMAVSTGGM